MVCPLKLLPLRLLRPK
jgi:hypothetical protein